VAEATDSKTDVESPMPPLEGELLRPGKAIKADSARLPAHVRTPARKWHRWCFALVAVVGAAGGGLLLAARSCSGAACRDRRRKRTLRS